MAASFCSDDTSSGHLSGGSTLTFLECLTHAKHGNEHDRHGPCLHGATRLVGEVGMEQKIPTAMSAPKRKYKVLGRRTRNPPRVREESGKGRLRKSC